jgi:hypothetical protein
VNATTDGAAAAVKGAAKLTKKALRKTKTLTSGAN